MAYRDALARLGQYKWFALTAAKLAPVDAFVLKKSGGRFGLMGNYGLSQCPLTTAGQKSGQLRTVTLIYGRERRWAVMCAMWPTCNAYRGRAGRAGREIKIFALS